MCHECREELRDLRRTAMRKGFQNGWVLLIIAIVMAMAALITMPNVA